MNNDASELLSARLWRWWQTQQQLKVAEAHGTQQAERAEKADQRIADLEQRCSRLQEDYDAACEELAALRPLKQQLAEAQDKIKRLEARGIESLKHDLAEAQKTEERIKVHLVEFYNDWQKGDFDLPQLAQLDLMSCMEAAGYGPLLEKMGPIN